MDQREDLRPLFHRLNNQLGIILSHAELLEAKSVDGPNRSRAALVVASVLEAMGTAREIRAQTLGPRQPNGPVPSEPAAPPHREP
jgi:hypothetical protein